MTQSMPTYVPRTVLFANQKGGVGKSSTAVSMATQAGSEGWKVLVVDADPQGNATSADFGYEGDDGQSLALALNYGQDFPEPVEVRPGVHLIAGGHYMSVVSASASMLMSQGVDIAKNLHYALYRRWYTYQYDLIIIDSGPGDAMLLDALLKVSQYLIVPSKPDGGSLDGVEQLARRYHQARQDGAQVTLLGILLFAANPRATRRNADIFDRINQMLAGSSSTPFNTIIRNDEATAIDQRDHGLTPRELVAAAARSSRSRIAALKSGNQPDERFYGKNPSGLAQDYKNLTEEVITRITAVEGGNQ